MWWLVLKAIFTLLPAIIQAVKNGQIKTAAQNEVLVALQNRIKVAKEAEGDLPDEADDPNNRDAAK